MARSVNVHVPGKDRSADRDLVADLPSELVGELAPGDRALAIDQERLALLRRDPELGDTCRGSSRPWIANCGKKLLSVM
jgi:hypothetical protein